MPKSLVLVDDIVIHQGDDRPLTWTLTDAEGQPVNLDGYSARAQVRTKPHAGTVLHEWSTQDGNAALAESSITLKVADSETWDWRGGVYDIHLTDPMGQTEVVVRGTVAIMPAVTR
jgi:hypothetical protein